MESGKQCLDCACAVGLGFGPVVFTLWASLGALGIFDVFLTSFDVPLGPHLRRSEKSGGRGGTPCICFQEQSTCDLYLEPLLPLRYGDLYWQPGGLVPRARGRIYVAFGEHPSAGGLGLKFVGWVVSVLCVVFVCGCVFVSVFVCVCVCVFVSLGVLLVVCV